METQSKKHCIVYGAHGLIESTICSILEHQYKDIKVTKIKCDETLPEMLLADYILFGSGYGQPLKFSRDKLRTIEINTVSLKKAFDFLKPSGKLLFVSTSEVYSGSPSPHREEMIGTTTPQHPRACYIEGKRCGEATCMAYREQGYDVKIARLALAYGPGTKKGDTRVLNQLIEQALTTGKIVLRDDGSAKRTYIYVEDAARLMLDILFEGESVVYNVGGFSTTTIRELADSIAAITGTSVTLGKNALDGAPSDVRLDMSKTLSEFPGVFTDLETGLKMTIKYQKQLYA